jgi:ribosome maturation factor RimP
MISENRIINLVEQHIQGTDIFLVEAWVKHGNAIRIHVDRPGGISIEECVEISRHLNRNLDREEEDYSLEVSSPGIGVPFKVKQQYEKNVGLEIEVIQTDGTTSKGTLDSCSNEGITLKSNKGVLTLNFDEIKSAREIIKFS